MAEAQHSTGPDNRWALLFTLYPICSIMTQRKGVTEGREEEWGELRKKCKSRTVVNLWPPLKCTLSSQPCCWTGSCGGAAKFSRPLRTSDWGMRERKKPSQGRSVSFPLAFLAWFGQRSHQILWWERSHSCKRCALWYISYPIINRVIFPSALDEAGSSHWCFIAFPTPLFEAGVVMPWQSS